MVATDGIRWHLDQEFNLQSIASFGQLEVTTPEHSVVI